MPMRNSSSPAEDSPPGAPAWMLTFGDCMTLLLTFFVLLLSFSSFDEAALARLKGAFHERPKETIHEKQEKRGDSFVPPADSVVDRTEQGAEKPDSPEVKSLEHPKASEPIPDTDAYSSEKVFYVSSTRLFWGEGYVLTPAGRELLESIASLMRLVPCKAVVAQMQRGGAAPGGRETALMRSWAIVGFLTGEQQGLPEERFSICATDRAPPARYLNESVIRITLLARDVTQ